jgi:hypothetical protein
MDLTPVFEETFWWHFIFLFVVSLFTRIFPRIFCPEARGKDAYYHLFAARRIRENGFKFPQTLDQFLLPGIYDYPPLFHYLLAFFPQSWHLKIERWTSAVFDAMLSIVVYVFSIYCLREANLIQDTTSIALWISTLFILSPSLTVVGTGPRAYQGTPRTLGELFFMLSLSCSIIHFFDGGLIFLLGAGFFGGFLLLTSKFGTQVFVFFFLIFLLWFREGTWLIVLILSFLVAWLFSWGHYKDIFLGHWEHCKYYRKAISRRFYLVTNKNRWANFLSVFKEFRREPVKAARIILMDNTYVLLLLKNPQLVCLLFLFLFTKSIYTSISAFFVVWTGAGILVFFLTSLKPLLFLGEADRYLEYSLFPQLLLITVSGYAFPLFYWIVGYEILLYCVFVAGFIYQYSQKAKDLPEFEEMVDFIRSDEGIKRILPIYLNEANQLAYESYKGIAHFPGNFREKYFSHREFLFFYDKVYPFPNENLQILMELYGYEVIYFSQKDILKAEQYNLKYDLKDWIVLFSNSKYKVLKPR